MTNELGNEPLADSVDVAAARMGIGRVRLYKEAKEGRLELRKCGRRTLVTREAQRRWINSLPVAGASAGGNGDPCLRGMSVDQLRAVIDQTDGPMVAA